MQPDHKKCPRCAEMIKMEALACRYCGQQFYKRDLTLAKGSCTQAAVRVFAGLFLGWLTLMALFFVFGALFG